MPRTTEDQILERLDNILKVLSVGLAADKTATEGIRLLKLAGLDNQTIAYVLDVQVATVRAISSTLRKRGSFKSRRGAKHG